jgi:hypothetical protein
MKKEWPICQKIKSSWSGGLQGTGTQITNSGPMATNDTHRYKEKMQQQQCDSMTDGFLQG